MMLRGRNAANADNVAAGKDANAGRPVKRHSAANNGGEKGEPTAKRVALKDVSNIRINSSKKATLKAENVKQGESYGKGRLARDVPASLDPCPGFDFDKENAGDLLSVSDYANDIFRYYKMREGRFRVSDYTKRQNHFAIKARPVLVDWMVELQEHFGLKHETLYLAVKLMDTYVSRTKDIIRRDSFHLISATAIFIACKYDESSLPLINDLIYVSEDSFTWDELCAMERQMFKVVGFDLGMPLSYRFLRRYAKVSWVDMTTLTLSRFILETSLMFVEFVVVPDSLMAAAAFLLALRMMKVGDWNPVLEKYSGYKLEDVEPLMWSLNHMMRVRPTLPKHSRLNQIFNKYSDETFFGVAETPLLEGGKSSSEPVGPPAALKTC
uniref:G2/mitotic-specific cyclin-B3 n=1 Tax=Steinernema glaseri TaxID=37863 RepID=A0A1I7YRQ1_9BILA